MSVVMNSALSRDLQSAKEAAWTALTTLLQVAWSMTRREKRDTLLGFGYLVLVRVLWGWTPGGIGGVVLSLPVAVVGAAGWCVVWAVILMINVGQPKQPLRPC